MFSLFCAVISSALVSLIMRLGESKSSGKTGLLLFNYAACSALGTFFVLRQGISAPASGLPFSLGSGILGGFLFLGSLMLLQYSVGKNGVILSAAFMKLGVLVPTLMAVLVFREQPKLTQILGFLLAIAAIALLHFEKGASGSASSKGLLLLLLIVGGTTDAMTNVYDKLGAPQWKELFLLTIFFTALLCTAFLAVHRRESIGKWDILCGLGVGIPNYFSSWFTLAALKTLPAVVVYPTYSVATIVVITLAGRLCFGEQLNRQKYAAIAVILVSLILLNL